MPRIFALFSLGFCLFILESCATILNGRYQKVPIVTDVSGADVYLNNERMDTTPCIIKVRRSTDITNEVRVVKPGYQEEVLVLNKKLNENSLLGIPYFLIPVAIDGLTGAIVRYQPPDTILLTPKKKSP
jgi:hypothetical protein